MRAYDGNIERQLRENGDKSASQNLREEVFKRSDTLAHMQLGLNTLKSSLADNILKPNFGKNDIPRRDAITSDRRDTGQQKLSQSIDDSRAPANGLQKNVDRLQTGAQSGSRNADSSPRNIDSSQKPTEVPKVDLSTPDMVSRALGNWQTDSRGNFVTSDRHGRLLTLDQSGKTIDYQTHLDQTKSSERTQMTLGSLLFCSPLMMFGMGAAFSFMDHITGKGGSSADQMRAKLDGSKKAPTIKGYSPEIAKLAALTIYQDTRFSAPNSLSGLAALRAKEEADKSKKKLEQTKRVTPHKVSMAPDSLTTQKMLKQKRRIENLLERIEGRASLAEISRLHSQLEVLDKALNRLGNLSM